MTQIYTPNIPKSNERICSHKNLYTNAYSSITDNSQRMETTQMSINSWIGEENVA